MKGEINSSNVKTNTLIVKIDWLNVELNSSQSVVTKKKNELKEVKEKLEKTEKQNEIQLKDLKKDYEASSKDLHLMTSRCDRLRDENNRLVPLPTPVRSRNFVTMSKENFDEGAKLLASAQSVAGSSAFAVFRALYERRAKTCSELAAN